PTINSYKRMVRGAWSPTMATWGVENRTTALRVIAGSPQATRVEYRFAAADMNAYIAMAASIASGLYGIEHELPLPPETQGNGYGKGAINELPNELKRAGATRPLLVTDKGILQAGLLRFVTPLLEQAGIRAHIFADFDPNPTDRDALRGIEAYRAAGADSVL